MGLRGNFQSRAVREMMQTLFARAAVDVARRSAWIEFARRVHDAAIDGSIRKLNAAEIEQFAVNCGALPTPAIAPLDSKSTLE